MKSRGDDVPTAGLTNLPHFIPRIPPDPAEQLRRERVLEQHSKKIQPKHALDRTAPSEGHALS